MSTFPDSRSSLPIFTPSSVYFFQAFWYLSPFNCSCIASCSAGSFVSIPSTPLVYENTSPFLFIVKLPTLAFSLSFNSMFSFLSFTERTISTPEEKPPSLRSKLTSFNPSFLIATFTSFSSFKPWLRVFSSWNIPNNQSRPSNTKFIKSSSSFV